MAYGDGRAGERWPSAALTAAAVAALGYALLSELSVSLPARAREVASLLSFRTAPPPPPPPERPPPPHRRTAEREGASAPPNLKSRATPVQAPPPPLPLQPPPITVAPLAATGLDASSGAALVAGPGTGAGGTGNGTGSGSYGNGTGAGGTAAVQLNDLRPGDLPADARAVLAQDRGVFVVGFRLTVSPSGRVIDCQVRRSSGSAAIDAGSCRAALAKLRFRPERDAAGRPIPVTFAGDQRWEYVDRERRSDDPQD